MTFEFRRAFREIASKQAEALLPSAARYYWSFAALPLISFVVDPGTHVDDSDVTYVDVEADRSGRVLAVGLVRAEQAQRIDVLRGYERSALRDIQLFVADSAIGGHNVVAFDLALLARPPIGWLPGERPVVDTLVLSLLADPTRASHALDNLSDRLPGALPDTPGALPDPLSHASKARDLARECFTRLSAIEPEVSGFYASLLAASGHRGAAERWARAGGFAIGDPDVAASCLPERLLARLCRVKLLRLLDTVRGGAPEESLALALAVRFIELTGRDGHLDSPPSPALASLPRFGELLTRLMGPLCPDHACIHRHGCDVHRPFAEEILASHFELPSFRPNQNEIVHAVLEGRLPLVLLPTGGGKSLCYQLPAVHGAERLRGLTVVVSPLVALMADQVRALTVRYPGACFVNSQLTLAERQQNLAGLRTGKYNIVYLGPEQLRNPGLVRLLRNRPPFLWVIDEAHCISQWGHGFRTDYTYLPRAIAEIHRLNEERSVPRLPPLVALFTATATLDVQKDVRTQLERGLGASIELMDFGAKRKNLGYEVVPAENRQQKDDELFGLLEATPAGARLVYCATVRAAKDVAQMLRERGVSCALYHGRLAPREKSEELERFLSGQARTVVATSAFGMGIDKPDIRLVVHYELPGSLEDYMQETGRAGRDGLPARAVLLYSEDDLETQFYLKSAGRVTGRDVAFVWKALRARARRFHGAARFAADDQRRRPGDDERVELWVVPEELFAEEKLDVELDWDRDELSQKLKLVLYHLESDGVLERCENRTRAFGIFPRLSSLELAEARLPKDASPATRRVLAYLYDPDRPRRISILELADQAGLLPAEAFREMQALTRLELVGHDLGFDVTLARGVSPSSRDIAQRRFQLLETLFKIGEDLDQSPVVHLRASAVEIGRRLGHALPPHELFLSLRALRRQGIVHLDKAGPGRYRVRCEPSVPHAIDALRKHRRTAEALLEYADRALGERRGRDVLFELDVERFLAEGTELFERRGADDVVSACLLLDHLEAWHLADPPVVLETALRVEVDPKASSSKLDLGRPRRQHEHEVGLVHLLREYAILGSERREAYVDDYFRLSRDELVEKYFKGRKRALGRSVSPAIEARLLEGLTPSQRDAVTAEDPAVLVVAGPGSGKTHTVVRRICHLVRARQVRPEEILVLAFNRSAAGELRVRLEKELGERASRIDVRTFHSLAVRLTGADLRDDGVDADLALDEALRRAAELLQAPPIGQSAQRAAAANTTAGEAPRAAATAALEPSEAEHARRQILGSVRHVIVDEYQDLDADQYRMLTGLVGLDRGEKPRSKTERSVYVVGDDDQAVYGFRAASVEFLRSFEEEFGARRICLSDCFRSNARIVESAAGFIASVPGRMKSKPEEQVRAAACTGPGNDASVRRFRYGSDEELAAHAAFVSRKSLERGAESVAVLARHWAALDPIRLLLEGQGVPFVVHHREFHRPLHRREPVFRTLRKLWADDALIEGSSADHLRAMLAAWKRSADEPPVMELLAFADEIDADRPRESGRLVPIRSKELADELLLACRDAAKIDRTATTLGSVHLATFHGSKGLEFDKVIVLPSRPADRASVESHAEERRLYYVAMTRARHELVLATLGRPGELALEARATELDLRGTLGSLPTARGGHLDATPQDVVLTNEALARAQGVISKLREGDALDVELLPGRTELRSNGVVVAVLSAAGQTKLEKLRQRAQAAPSARVHEVYVHVVRDAEGSVRRRWLVVLPALRVVER